MSDWIPKVSIIIPVYKAEKYIERCVSSILAQTLNDIEIILVNDASPDTSLEKIISMSLSDSRIRYIDNNINRGPMVVRHQGCLAAKGEFVTFLDSDDWLPIDSLELLYESAMESGSDVVCGLMQRVHDGNPEPVALYDIGPGRGKVDMFEALLSKKINQCLCSKLFRRSLWRDFDYQIVDHCTQAEDAGALFQYVNHCSSFSVINNVVYYYYQNYESSSYNYSIRSYESIYKNTIIREIILAGYPELDEPRKRYFTNNLYMVRSNKDAYRLLNIYGLQKYASLKYILKYVSLKGIIKLIVAWCEQPFRRI